MTSLYRLRGIAFLCVLFLLAEATRAVSAELQAGIGRANLTPPLEMKAALGGYGARDSRPAVGVHDAVWAKALVLSQGDRKFAVVTADALAFPPQFKAAMVARLAAEGWSADQILLLPSHSHTSLDMMALHPGNTFGNKQVGLFHKELFEFASQQLAEAVRNASRTFRPIQVGAVTLTIGDRNRNRRGLATRDTDLTVTRVDTTDGAPVAVLVNWTAHPTFMDENDMMFSGDWPGHLQRTVEALVGRGVTAMYYNGAEGDQSPVPSADCSSHWERAERYGREMGIKAWQAWQQIRPHSVKIFATSAETIALPKIQWHPDFMKTGGAEYGLNEAGMRAFLDALQPTQTRTICLRLDDLVILGVPGEMAAQLGLEAKAQARKITGANCVTIGGLANEWVSYILPAGEYRKGGYEASMSFYGESLGDTMLQGVVGAARALK